MSRSSEDGVSLVSTLILLALLSSIVVSFIYLNRDTILETTNRVQLAQARASSDAGLELAVFGLQSGSVDPLTPDGGTRTCRLQRSVISFTVTDEAGKIDLNGASGELIADFASLYVDDIELARSIANRILDFRDADDDERPAGAEINTYEELGLTHGPKNRPFQLVDELYQVAGLPDEFIRRASRYFTVHSRRSGIAPEYASLPVLLAVTGSEIRLSEESVADIGQSEWARLRQIVPAGRKVRSPAQNYSVDIIARQDSGFVYAETVTFTLMGQGNAPTLLERRRLPSSILQTNRSSEPPQPRNGCLTLFETDSGELPDQGLQ